MLLSLALASMAAFALSRYAIPGRQRDPVGHAGRQPAAAADPADPGRTVHGVPRHRRHPVALVAVHVGFGLGFYTFVLHGFMRTIPQEITEAATIDGAGPGADLRDLILPLSRPALAALAALAFTWIFNDLLWALTVLRTGRSCPSRRRCSVCRACSSPWNVIAAGSVIAAVPTVAVFLRFQKHFVGGLAIGAVGVETWTLRGTTTSYVVGVP